MPRVFIGKRVLFATSHTQPQWRPAICLTQGDDPTGIDLAFFDAKPNSPNGRLVHRDACRHVNDPASRDVNYLNNIEQDNEGGLWKEDEESLLVERLRADVDQLKAIVRGQGAPPEPAKANGKVHWKTKQKLAKQQQKPAPPVPAAATEPDLDLVS
jgi:hypothetical protein